MVPPSLHGDVLLALTGVAGLAGFLDAIAGGGGLLTVPALLMAGLPPHLALGTNKGQSVWGSGAALVRFARSPLLDRKRAPLAFASGLAGAVAGTLLVQVVPAAVLRPLVLVLLIGAALAILLVRPPAHGTARSRPAWLTGLVAGGLGAYDGFFGPGTGTFLLLAFVVWWNETFATASANAKTVNCASNLGSLAVFAALGQVAWVPALCMGAGQWIGGWCGAHVVIHRGQRLVRTVAVCISLALCGRLLWLMLQPSG